MPQRPDKNNPSRSETLQMNRTGINPFDWPRNETPEESDSRFKKLMNERPVRGDWPPEALADSGTFQWRLKEIMSSVDIPPEKLAQGAGIDPVYVRLLHTGCLGDDELDARAIVKICQAAGVDPTTIEPPKSWGKSWQQVFTEFDTK